MINVEKNINDFKNEISELQQDLYQNDYSYSAAEIKTIKRRIRACKKAIVKLNPAIVPGGTYSIIEFMDSLSYSGKKDTPKKEFLSYYNSYYNEKELDVLNNMLQYHNEELAVWNYFNKHYRPTNIKRQTLSATKAEVKSSNIYDKMAAASSETRRDSFDVVVQYNQEPITVYFEYEKNTTLSMRDIVNFM